MVLTQRGHLIGDRVGVGGVAGEGLHGDRAAIAIAQQAAHDLRSVGAVVAGVAVRGELAAGAFEVAGGEVVESEGAVLKLARSLEPGLSRQQAIMARARERRRSGLWKSRRSSWRRQGGGRECGAVGTDGEAVGESEAEDVDEGLGEQWHSHR